MKNILNKVRGYIPGSSLEERLESEIKALTKWYKHEVVDTMLCVDDEQRDMCEFAECQIERKLELLYKRLHKPVPDLNAIKADACNAYKKKHGINTELLSVHGYCNFLDIADLYNAALEMKVIKKCRSDEEVCAALNALPNEIYFKVVDKAFA